MATPKMPEKMGAKDTQQYAEMVCIECRLCGQHSPWLPEDTPWDSDHFKTAHPDRRPSDWSAYRWTLMRQIVGYR